MEKKEDEKVNQQARIVLEHILQTTQKGSNVAPTINTQIMNELPKINVTEISITI